MERTLIATTPAAMVDARFHMVDWCKARIEANEVVIADSETEHAIAVKNGWRPKAWERRMNEAKRRVDFYKKIIAALESGFYIVPNFAMHAFAIRTKAKNPSGGESDYQWEEFRQNAQILARGDGHYVSPLPAKASDREERERKDGTKYEQNVYWPEEFKEVEFPIHLAKLETMKATEKAMALQVFDEIGEARDAAQGCGDPMILGRILNPRRGRAAVTFFISWIMPLEYL